jgi:hypothetical protein
MIVSHKHKFILLRSRKTAGSSIALVLNHYLGPRDIQVGGWSEAIKAGGKFNRAAIVSAVLHRPRKVLMTSLRYSIAQRRLALNPEMVERAVRHYQRIRNNLGTHATASDVRKAFPAEWHRYFKFVVVRNPWDRAVSDYYWRTAQRGKNVSFREFLLRLEDLSRPDPEDVRPPVVDNWDIYTIDDQIAVDHVVRYENLVEDLRRCGEAIGVEIDITGVDAKAGIRPQTIPVADHYSDETIALVGRVFHKEVAHFSYKVPF